MERVCPYVTSVGLCKYARDQFGRAAKRRSEEREDLFGDAGHLLVSLLVGVAEEVGEDREVLEPEQVAVERDAFGDLVRSAEEDRLLGDRFVERRDQAWLGRLTVGPHVAAAPPVRTEELPELIVTRRRRLDRLLVGVFDADRNDEH